MSTSCALHHHNLAEARKIAMRTRITDDRTDINITIQNDTTYLNNCAGDTPVVISKSNVGGTYIKTHDVVIKRFRERSAKGETFFNPFARYEESRGLETSGWGGTRTTENYACYKRTGDGPLWMTKNDYPYVWHVPAGMNLANLRNLAATQALAGVKKPEHASLVSLGELRETISYIKNPLNSLTTYIRKNRTVIQRDLKREAIYRRRLAKSMRRGTNFQRANRYASKALRGKRSLKQRLNSNEVRAISDAYLGGRYGLRPLVGEVQSIMSAIDANNKKSPPRETSRGFASDSATAIRSGPSRGAIQSWWSYTSEDVTDHQAECSAGVLYSVDIRDTWGTDFSQVPVALWETTFLSFMADWFANMGDFLAAVTPKAGIRRHGSWVTMREVRETVRTVDFNFLKSGDPDYSETISPDGREYVTSHNTRRIPNISAGLAYRPSGVRFDLGTARIVDMFAIARNLLF